MDAADKLSRAKSALLLKHPYFGHLASRLSHAVNNDLEAFLSDGKVFQYNEDYLADASSVDLQFALANSVMHHVLSHENRQSGRMGWLWQLATDHAINSMLVENGFALPPRVNYDERFAGMYAEEIYIQLKSEIKNEDYDGNEENETGFNEQNKRRQKEQHDPAQNTQGKEDLPLPPAELEPEVQEEWEAAAKMIEDLAKEQGELPAAIERLIEGIGQSAVDWRHELFNALNRHAKSDYAFMPPNKKMAAYGIALPSLRSETLVITVAVDTSGSIDAALLELFMAEVEAILLNFPTVELDLIAADAKVHAHECYRSGEPIEMTLKGGGGTDFRSVFDYIDAQIPMTEVLVYFTDLEGRFPEHPPHYEVLWAVKGTESDRQVPFGQIIPLP